MPDPGPDSFYELRHGELIRMTMPKVRHKTVQANLHSLLSLFRGSDGFLSLKIPFRALPEYELRSAEVAWMPKLRWLSAEKEGYLDGAPDLVIEVISPSNTVEEMRDKRSLCLANGCKEYGEGDLLPLSLLGDATISVAAIFEGA
jgi:Uma2 family endonuclease